MAIHCKIKIVRNLIFNWMIEIKIHVFIMGEENMIHKMQKSWERAFVSTSCQLVSFELEGLFSLHTSQVLISRCTSTTSI